MSKGISRLLVVLLCLGLLAVAVPASAEETRSITVNPFGFLLGSYNAEYEQLISDKLSFTVGGNFQSLKLAGWEFSGFGGSAGVKYYLNTPLRGAWVGGGAEVSSAKMTYTTTDIFTGETLKTEASGTLFGIFGLVGYKWIVGGGFTTDVALGVRQTFGEMKVTAGSETLPTGVTGFGPALKLQLGYSF
ncbi:MAG: DUF3575 domain-containing protein [Syntrophothermus sp.]